MKKFTIGMIFTLLIFFVGSAFADTFCMTSDATVFIDGQEDMLESSSTKRAGVEAGMFDLDFNAPKYTILKDDEYQWIGWEFKSEGENTMSTIATMDWPTMTYTKHLAMFASEDGGHTANYFIVNKCKGSR